jgi:hypothetical protein
MRQKGREYNVNWSYWGCICLEVNPSKDFVGSADGSASLPVNTSRRGATPVTKRGGGDRQSFPFWS